jgi:2-polyprenyl-6-hydroxyphenyl methylase/3-demethylubiquinone-9 3-methyltransferase
MSAPAARTVSRYIRAKGADGNQRTLVYFHLSEPVTMNAASNADQAELDKFGDVAHHWWDPNSSFRPLHDINPARVAWIDSPCCQLRQASDRHRLRRWPAQRRHGGAWRRGHRHRPSEKALGVARLHLYESGHKIDYRLISPKPWRKKAPAAFDHVTCLEMLEHVPDPASTVAACASWSSRVARFSCPR